MQARPVDPSALEWKSRTALTSLSKTSSADVMEMGKTEAAMAPLLCYACLTTFTPSLPRRNEIPRDPVLLPRWISEGVEWRRKEFGMKDIQAEIGQYLLQEDDGE